MEGGSYVGGAWRLLGIAIVLAASLILLIQGAGWVRSKLPPDHSKDDIYYVPSSVE